MLAQRRRGPLHGYCFRCRPKECYFTHLFVTTVQQATSRAPFANLGLVHFNAPQGKRLGLGCGDVRREMEGLSATLVYVGIGSGLAIGIALLVVAILFLRTARRYVQPAEERMELLREGLMREGAALD